MNFIFPKNYNFKPKLFGFVEYSTAILDTILGFIIYFFVDLIFKNINLKIYIFISLFLPILLISIFGINKENPITVFKYFLKFIKNQKIYLYSKNHNINKKHQFNLQSRYIK